MADRGEADRLAPVIPLFGGSASATPAPASTTSQSGASSQSEASERGTSARRTESDDGATEPVVPRRTGDSGLWRSTWDDDRGLRSAGDSAPSARHPAFAVAHGEPPPRLRVLGPHVGGETSAGSADGPADDRDEARERAEAVLVRKLRARALSVSEARGVLRENGLTGEAVDSVLDDFERRGYIDDRTLAGHLVTAGVERKGQGRTALARVLSQRGIPRAIADEVLAELPDDDAERALDFARTKAGPMARLDPDTALRRLVGQLARRGYRGSVAMDAARTALREAGGGRGGVRFVDSE